MSRREFEHRVADAEQAFESYRSALRAVTSGGALEPDDAVNAFNELLALARAIGREEERRREKLYVAEFVCNNRTYKFGPTSSRDSAAALANGWQSSHGAIISRGSGILGGIETRLYDPEKDKEPEGDEKG